MCTCIRCSPSRMVMSLEWEWTEEYLCLTCWSQRQVQILLAFLQDIEGFYCEMQIKYRKCLSSLVFLYLTSAPAPSVPILSLCSGLCSAGVGTLAGWGQPRCASQVKEAFLGTKWGIWKVLHSWFSVRLSPAKAPGQTQWEGLRSVQVEKCCRILWLTTHCWGCLNVTIMEIHGSLTGSKVPTCLSGSVP